jgi:hypothetical protein
MKSSGLARLTKANKMKAESYLQRRKEHHQRDYVTCKAKRQGREDRRGQ